MPKTRPPYDPEFRSQMIEMVKKEGRAPADLSAEHLKQSTLLFGGTDGAA